jgi:hypothetical protein
VITNGLATLHELQTVYGVADLYRLIEVIEINRYNEWLADRHQRLEMQRRGG